MITQDAIKAAFGTEAQGHPTDVLHNYIEQIMKAHNITPEQMLWRLCDNLIEDLKLSPSDRGRFLWGVDFISAQHSGKDETIETPTFDEPSKIYRSSSDESFAQFLDHG
jgi:hypothetical protein